MTLGAGSLKKQIKWINLQPDSSRKILKLLKSKMKKKLQKTPQKHKER